MQGLDNAITKVKLHGSLGAEIQLKRGVQQGDPLSPLLSNLVINQLLENLNTSEYCGGEVGKETRFSVIAFAKTSDHRKGPTILPKDDK